MRLDHIAFRVPDRFKAAEFWLSEPFNYKIQAEFEIPELCTRCLALTPPEKELSAATKDPLPFIGSVAWGYAFAESYDYHLAPEIFISSSEDPNSPVGNWVKAKGGGGVHHMAYNVSDVKGMMEKLRATGWQFTTEVPIVDEDLTQCFTKPLTHLGGLIIEFINRPASRGFSTKNVRDLMRSTEGLK